MKPSIKHTTTVSWEEAVLVIILYCYTNSQALVLTILFLSRRKQEVDTAPVPTYCNNSKWLTYQEYIKVQVSISFTYKNRHVVGYKISEVTPC